MIDDERRTFQRFPIRAFAELGNSKQEWAAHVLDISFHGARIALLEEYSLCTGEAVKLRVEVPELYLRENMPHYLHLKGMVVHQQEHMLGIEYEASSVMDAELLTNMIAYLDRS